MKFLKWLLIVLLGLVLLLVVVALFLPKQVKVDRAISIDAPPYVVYGLLDNYRRFNEWSPWAKLDPKTEYEFSGPDSGVGAKMTWKSDHPHVGSGYQEITEAVINQRIKNHLDFGENGNGDAAFILKPEGEGTHVTWDFETYFGNDLIGRYVGLFMDKMLGPIYEEGLASLKTLAESEPKMDFSDLESEVIEVTAQPVAYMHVKSAIDPQAISTALGGAFGAIGAFLQTNGLQMSGAPLTINHGVVTEYDVDAAIPINQKPENYDESGEVKVRDLYAGKVLKVIHRGAYTKLGDSYAKATAFIRSNGWEVAGASWDAYVTDPGNTPEDALVTHMFIPIKQ